MCFSSSCGPKCTARFLVRIGFGLSLLFTGIANYRDPSGFADSVGQGLGYPWLESLGTMWGYVLPLLFIVGGLSLIFNILTRWGVWAAGLGLVSIPAGLMLKSAASGISLGDTMPPAMNAFIWILVFMYAVKGTKKHCHGMGGGCGCAGGACDCSGKGGACPMCGMNPCMCGMSKKASTPVKSSMPTAPSATVKAMPKKAPAKKAPAKKTPSAPKDM